MPRRTVPGTFRDSRLRLYFLAPPGSPPCVVPGSPAPIQAVECVARIPTLDRHTWLITSTAEFETCCRRPIARWRRRRGGFLQILRLEDVAPTLHLCELQQPSALRGIDLDRLRALLVSRGFLSDARRAWSFPLQGRRCDPPPQIATDLLNLINRSTATALTVEAAARALNVAPRRLHRLSLRLFGQPPHILLALGRVRAVARAIRDGAGSLERIAEEHGFPDPGSMSRMFVRYVGIRPGAYRKRASEMLSDRAIDQYADPS